MDNKMVLITLIGPDRPGILAAVTGAIAEGGARIRDIEQSVTHTLMLLSLLIDFPDSGSDQKPLIKDLLFLAKELGLELDFEVVEEKDYLKRLHSLDLSNSGMIDEFLPRLSHFPHLVTLDLRNTMVGSGVRQVVTDLTALDEIELKGTRVGMLSRWLIGRQLARRHRTRPIAVLFPNC